MRPIKKSLSLNRETIRQLTRPDLSAIHVGIEILTARCPSWGCPTFITCATHAHSCFNSCVDTDCCLEVP
jgi:hypothetical protein